MHQTNFIPGNEKKRFKIESCIACTGKQRV